MGIKVHSTEACVEDPHVIINQLLEDLCLAMQTSA